MAETVCFSFYFGFILWTPRPIGRTAAPNGQIFFLSSLPLLPQATTAVFGAYPMRPKARGLVQHGGLPGWQEESDPAGVILYVMDGPYCLPFPYRTGTPDRSCTAAS
jgi:hypothetical protein